MSTPNTATIIKTRRKRILNSKAIFIFLLLAIGALISFYYVKSKASTKGEIIQQTAIARRGDLKVSISGSGTLASSSTLTALSNVEGTISQIYFKDGDTVEAGSLIMELDSGEARLNVKKLENSIAQARLSRDQILKSLDSSQVIAPISGQITDIKFKEGDNTGKDSSLLTITDKSRLKLLLPFNNAYKSTLQPGQKAAIYAFDSSLSEMNKLEGTISFISSTAEDTEEAQPYNVEFTIENPGYLDDTMIASAETTASGQTLKSIGSAKLSYMDSIAVKTETGGLIESLDAALGQYVKKGDILANITNDDLFIELETKNLNIEDMESQLEYATAKLYQYKIYSTISGVLSISDVKKGDGVKSGQTVFKVSNYDLMEFQIPVDELDIAKIQTNQAVNVTVDALPETSAKPLKGIVAKIAQEGTPSNSVTTYPVTVQLTESNSSLKVGMNANGEIIVNEKTNALYVPIEAVQKIGNTNVVFVKSDEAGTKEEAQPGAQSNRQNRTNQQASAGQQASDNSSQTRTGNRLQSGGYYAGAVPKTVEVGINNDEYIEIISGLKEGDIVILPRVSSGSGSANSQNRYNRTGGGMPGGMTGGMPVTITREQGR